MDQLATLVSQVKDFIWDNLLLYILILTGIIFSIRLKFIQVRKFGEGMRRVFGGINLFGKHADKDGMSSGVGNGHCGPGRYGQHHRLRNRVARRRPWRHFLDVVVRVLWHGNDLRRGCAGPKV